VLETGAQWPPDRERIEGYRRFECLYRGDHRSAFKEKVASLLFNKGGDGLTWLALDYPRTIVDIPADLLVGAPPVISYEDKTLNAAWQDIAERSRFDACLLELAQDKGMRGDAVIEARGLGENVLIEPKPAYCYFPELSLDNVREVRGEALAWSRGFEGMTVVRVDRYTPGKISREAYVLDGMKMGRRIIGAQLSRVLGPGVPEESRTGVERSTLVHVPNTRGSNDFFGRSDLGGGLVTLFEEVDERLSQIVRILDKHASPKMAGPANLIDQDGNVNLLADYFGVSGNQPVPQYLTWDAQLIAAFEAYKAVKDEIFRHSQISPLLAGYVNGASYDSGRAYKMQLAPTLAKTARKGLYLDAGLREAVRLAVAIYTGKSYSDTPAPNIRWRDGLPKDLQEMATTNGQRIEKGTLSRRSAIMSEMDCDEATADNEIARIDAENKPLAPSLMAPEINTSTPEHEALG